MADLKLERRDALSRAGEFFDSGAFRDRLSALIAYRSTSQDPGHDADLRRYLEEGLRPWVESMGFVTAIHDNPDPGFGPILTGTRIEDPARPTIILYGHSNGNPCMLPTSYGSVSSNIGAPARMGSS